ncbi:MAG: GTP-binding protein [Clostridia bacterium]
MKIDIITGFLGAGKTTFIAKYAKYLQNKKEKILVIENELSIAGVDGFELKEENLQIAEISGGCACCTQVPKLIECINYAYEDGYDRIIFEPTGIYNVDSFFGILNYPSLTAKFDIGAIITIVKPDFMIHDESLNNILLSQFLSTGAVVFSNTQSYSTEEISQSIYELNNFTSSKNEFFDISKISIFTKVWDDFTSEDFEELSAVGRTECEHRQVYENHALILQSMFFLGRLKEASDIEKLTKELFEIEDMGILRIKGYFSDKEKNIYFINNTNNCSLMKESTNKHTLVAVIGTNIDDGKIKAVVDKYKL